MTAGLTPRLNDYSRDRDRDRDWCRKGSNASTTVKFLKRAATAVADFTVTVTVCLL